MSVVLADARGAGLVAALGAGRARRRRRRLAVHTALVLVTAALVTAAVFVGTTDHPPADVLAALLGQDVPGTSFAVTQLRLPRAVTGLATGVAFGVAGTVFQTLLRNPLASPDVIGISAGSSAAAVLGIVVLGVGDRAVGLLALAGGLGTALVIYLLAVCQGFAGTRLILIGIGVAAMLQSVVAYLLSRAPQWDLQAAMQWLTGSLTGASWVRTAPLLVALGVALPVVLGRLRALELVRLGDEVAAGLGVPVGRLRPTVMAAAVVLLALGTAAAGPIAFVAFMAGPIAARLIGPGASPLPAAGLVGAALVLAADLLGQLATGTRYPVGVVTGVLGAPYLLALLVRSYRTGGAL